MFHSITDKNQGTQEPDDITIEHIHDEDFGGIWLQIRWSGSGYEDAWFLSENQHVVDLEENR